MLFVTYLQKIKCVEDLKLIHYIFLGEKLVNNAAKISPNENGEPQRKIFSVAINFTLLKALSSRNMHKIKNLKISWIIIWTKLIQLVQVKFIAFYPVELTPKKKKKSDEFGFQLICFSFLASMIHPTSGEYY